MEVAAAGPWDFGATLGQDRDSFASLQGPTTAGVRISNQPITAFFGSENRTIWTECTIVPSCTRTAGFTPLTSAGASSEGGTKAGSPCALPDALVTADHLGSVIDRPESEMSTLQTPPMTDSGVCTAESSTKDVIKMNLCWRASTNAMEGAGDTDSEFVDTCLKKDVGIAISSTSRPHAREQDHEGDERHTAHTDNQIAIASACPRQRSFTSAPAHCLMLLSRPMLARSRPGQQPGTGSGTSLMLMMMCGTGTHQG